MTQKGMTFSAGMRLKIRDAEWFVRRVEPVRVGGQALYVRGVTCPVQGRDQIFWTEAERDAQGNVAIEVILPENTQLSLDTSSHAIKTRLRIESVARHNPVSGRNIVLAHHAAMDVLNYQLQPAYHALNSERDPRSRILIADAVGLGKTLEAGILLSELICRDAGKRILVVTLKSMMAQFQKEMWCRFSIPLVRLDSAGLQRIRSDIPSNHNPFNFYDKTIVSVDTLKQDNQFRSALESAHWDVIVIDEAHNVAARGKNQRAQRARLAEKLAALCDHMILLSATPHDGSKESFASLMTLLDPLAIPNPSKYGPKDIEGLFERRFKKDVADEIAAHFPERVLVPIEAEASLAERALYDALKDVKLEMDSRRGKGDVMFRTTLVKSLLSSPAAFIETVRHRLANPRTTPADAAQLKGLLDMAMDIGNADFTKYQCLVRYLKDKKTGWNKKDSADRLVIFTERIETKRFLVETLAKDLGLDVKAIASIDGRMKDVYIMQVVEQFGLANSPLRILIASDVASEGINLHYFAHRLIHFDIPWSLITFQQRNGRIDRYGQKAQPIITFLLSSVDGTQDDLNVMRHVINREINAHDNIGDPGQLMGVYDASEEENIVARAYQSVKDGSEVIAAIDAQIAEGRGRTETATQDADEDFNLMDLIGAGNTAFGEDAGAKDPKRAETMELPSIFKVESDYLAAGLNFMQSVSNRKYGELTRDERTGLLRLPMTENLGAFCRHVLPYELRKQIGESGELMFTTDPKTMQVETDLARNLTMVADDDDTRREAWPTVSYLWPLNPISQWITENVNATFGSQSAPVLKVAECKNPAFLIYAQAPNEHGEPLVQGWFKVEFCGGTGPATQNVNVAGGRLEDLIAPYGLDRAGFSNTAAHDEKLDAALKETLDALRLPAIEAVKPHLDKLVAEYETVEGPRNTAILEKLDARLKNSMEQLEFVFDGYETVVKKLHQSAFDRAKRNRQEAYDNFKNWADTHRRPAAYRHCQIIAVFVGK
ncbi:MAG: DEAD/DEAH box helicase [Kiritimatiellae bacterium]|nr:DEAD/DEAH box helicase [Kiritimatiellia bacterium]